MTSLVHASTGEVIVLLDENEARNLTDRIRAATESLWGLLLEAHERQAWRALGYGSWRAYATTEFGMGQSRAYQLLDQARVVVAIAEAADSTTVEMSERAAREIKPRLAEVVDIVRDRTARVAKERVAEVVREVIAEERAKSNAKAETDAAFAEFRPSNWGPAEQAADAELTRQRGALSRLCRDIAALGDPAHFVDGQRAWLLDEHITNATAAREWLAAFLDEVGGR